MNEEIVTIGGVECLPLKAAAKYLGMTISSFYGTVSRFGLVTVNIPHTKNHKAIPVDELRRYQEASNASSLSARLGDAAIRFMQPLPATPVATGSHTMQFANAGLNIMVMIEREIRAAQELATAARNRSEALVILAKQQDVDDSIGLVDYFKTMNQEAVNG